MYSLTRHIAKSETTPSLLWLSRCDLSDVENFKTGKVPLLAPGTEYANTLTRGLVEGDQLSEAEAKKYIEEAAAKPL